MGWHVILEKDRIGVCRHFKNGKPRKTPDVNLAYDEFTYDIDFDWKTGETIETKRESVRPYRLDCRAFNAAKTYGKLASALAAFLTEARQLAPNRQTTG